MLQAMLAIHLFPTCTDHWVVYLLVVDAWAFQVGLMAHWNDLANLVEVQQL